MPTIPPDAETIAGLGNRKNEIVLRLIHEQGVEAYEGSVRYLEAARDACAAAAVVSSSTNCREVLAAAGIEGFFDARIDGVVAEREHLKGKPAPDTFLAAAARARRRPGEAAVFEDALAGVAAGRAGGFACVVGVDRVGHAEALREHGADGRRQRPRRAARGPMIAHALLQRASRGRSAKPSSTSPCWPTPSRSSPSPTGTSGCAATSTRASRTACPAPT